ncbi:MAG: thioesterase family protein [Saprospiraceae bacterium]
MIQHNFTYRVTYGDTDMMGYFYYGNYAKLYEIGRVETMRSVGISYKELESTHKIMLPVVSLESRFRFPAKYDEILKISTFIKEVPSKMITFETDIHNEQQQLIHTAVVKLFFIDMENNSRVSCPDWMVQIIKQHF